MAKEVKKDSLLTSWKAIASYLDCDVRTCMRWEKKYGLPVYRIDGTAKATVFAYKDELDKWLSRFSDSPSQAGRPAGRRLSGLQIFTIIAVVSAVLAVRFLLLPRILSHPVPFDFRVEKSELVILDDDGKELWRYDTGVENLVGEREYRQHFQYTRRMGLEANLPHLIIEDINRDGKKEVLFSIQTRYEFHEGTLLCFSHRGKLLWEYAEKRELKFGTYTYSPDYIIRGFEASDLDGEGKLEIIVISDHKYFFPTQLAVLDCGGEKIGEYWNCGRLGDFVCVDLDGDGRKEILAAGCNNDYDRACLVVLDSAAVKGMSPHSADFDCQDIGPGSEKQYILFPSTDVCLLAHVRDFISKIEVLSNRRLLLYTAHSNIFFKLNFDLDLVDIRLSDSFRLKHRLAVEERRIHSELNEAYKQKLAREILRYDGQDWIALK